MARRFKGKQLTKHLVLTGSLAISGSESSLPNSASLSINEELIVQIQELLE